MTERILNIVTFACALGAGLIGGAFLAFSTFVMGALARLPAPHGIAAMQSINIVVINPLFLGVMFGTGGACIGLIVAAVLRWHVPGAGYLLTGGLVYLIGCILVTMFFNVPRNNALMALDPNTVEAATFWNAYIPTWTTWNHVRTIAGVVASGLFILALL